MHDPALGRFMGIDLLAEDYSFQSPYAYAVNNPIRYIDLFGMGPKDKTKDRTEKTMAKVEFGRMVRSFFADLVGYGTTEPNNEVGNKHLNVTVVGGGGNDIDAPKPNEEAKQMMVDFKDISDAQLLTMFPNSKSKPTKNEQIDSNKNTGQSTSGGTTRSNAKDKVATNTNKATKEATKTAQSEADSVSKVYVRSIGADGQPSSTVTKKVHRYTNKGREISDLEK